MADDDSDKTEDPTGKRLGEAREKGQVGKSREVDHWFMLLAITLVIFIFGPRMGSDIKDTLIIYIAQTNQIPVDQNALQGLFWHLAGKLALILAPSIALLFVAGVGSAPGSCARPSPRQCLERAMSPAASRDSSAQPSAAV